MAECRYFPECQRCNEVGDSWLPCAGGSDWTRCKGYESMPDVKALLALAEELDGLGLSGFSSGWSSGTVNVGYFARRIRGALGVVADANA